MRNILSQKLVKAIEKLGWSVMTNTPTNIVLRNYSPAGEEMYLGNESLEDLIRECESYDIDDHFNVWYGANRGEPYSVRALLEDCEAQGIMYDQLFLVLKNTK